MIKQKSTLFLGIFILVIPFLGIPASWKTTCIVLSALTLVALSVKIVLPKKPSKTRVKREKITPVFVENSPIFPKEVKRENLEMHIVPIETPDSQ